MFCRQPSTLRSLKIYTIVLLGALLTLAFLGAPHSHPSIIMWLVAIFGIACLVKPIPHPCGGIIHPIGGIIVVAGLLWDPQDVLIAVGIGCFWSLLLFQRTGLWKAGTNAAGWAVDGMAAALMAHWVLSGTSPLLLSVPIAALFSFVVHYVINKTIFAVYRHLRFGYPFLQHLRDNLTFPFLGELFPLPMIVTLAWMANLLRTVEWGLILTAAYVLVLSIPHRKAKGCFRSHELVGEVAENALRTLSQSEKAASLTGSFGSSLRRLWGAYSASPAFAGLASVRPIGTSILAAAEAYENTCMTFGLLPRSILCEDVERECKNLTGINPDPNIVPVLLSVAETTKMPPMSKV